MNDRNYKYCPSEDEWKRGEKISEFLLPFYDTTNLISGTSYPTSNLYFLQVWKIECVLRENLSSEDEVIKAMAGKMWGKFNKYWDEYSVTLALGAVLDPRMKTTSLTYCYSKIDPKTCDGKVEYVKSKLYKLFENYANKNSPNIASASQNQASSLPKKSKARNERMFGVSYLYFLFSI